MWHISSSRDSTHCSLVWVRASTQSRASVNFSWVVTGRYFSVILWKTPSFSITRKVKWEGSHRYSLPAMSEKDSVSPSAARRPLVIRVSMTVPKYCRTWAVVRCRTASLLALASSPGMVTWISGASQREDIWFLMRRCTLSLHPGWMYRLTNLCTSAGVRGQCPLRLWISDVIRRLILLSGTPKKITCPRGSKPRRPARPDICRNCSGFSCK
mmetsp:Transcript_54091/g.96249  ORF Transcript_54091/g.96249 Transcript_54091/m.96249 type:complete len:212 (-) Transcript_54091:2573-3208(-)